MTQTLKQKARIRAVTITGRVCKVETRVGRSAWFRLSRMLESRPMAYLTREGRGWRAVDTVPPRNFFFNNPAELYEPLWSAATINTLISQGTLHILEHDEDGRPLRAKHWRGSVT